MQLIKTLIVSALCVNEGDTGLEIEGVTGLDTAGVVEHEILGEGIALGIFYEVLAPEAVPDFESVPDPEQVLGLDNTPTEVALGILDGCDLSGMLDDAIIPSLSCRVAGFFQNSVENSS